MITGHSLLHIAYLSWANKSPIPSFLAHGSWWKYLSVSLRASLLLLTSSSDLEQLFFNSLTHNIQATWMSEGWCKHLRGAYVCVHVYVLYMWIPGVCMFVSESLAAGYRSCVGGLSLVCARILCQVLLSLFEGHEGPRILFGDYTGRPAGSWTRCGYVMSVSSFKCSVISALQSVLLICSGSHHKLSYALCILSVEIVIEP